MSTRRTSKMPTHLLCGSATFVWSTGSVLGKGATGAVYQGINKTTGETVAVKTFNHLSHMRPDHVQMREFEVLKKVGHPNIVSLLAIEQEQGTENKVLVMQLCTGGSLFNLLDDPENTFGLQESEFLLVLEHVSAGMNHLHDNNIVHRDLKPGNIMKYIELDGRSVYKLTDFGAARELPEDQQFMSLYGTEEYLHPDMYERAVLRKSPNKTFGATVDLWSIGVTLYHVATGSLPFRPFGGRKNKETMHRITTKKESGVMSGVQVSENGPIEWGRRLPDTCQLSIGLQKLVTSLLAGLLETSSTNIWTFDQFFAAVTDILAHRRLHVFYVNQSQLLHVYVKSDASPDAVQSLIREQTDVAPQNQFVIHDNVIVYEGTRVQPSSGTYSATSGAHLVTTEDKPMFLFRREESLVEVSKKTAENTPKYPSLPSVVSVEKDATDAKVLCSTAYAIKRLAERCCASVQLLNLAVVMFLNVLKSRVTEIEVSLRNCEALNERDVQRTYLISTCYRFCASVLDIVFPDSMETVETSSKQLRDLVFAKEESCQTVSDNLQSMTKRLQPLLFRTMEDQVLLKSWHSVSAGATDISRSPLKAATYTQRIKDSWQILCRDRNSRALSYNEEQFHILEKTKLTEASQRLLGLYQEECLRGLVQVTEHMTSWLRAAWGEFKESVYLLNHISSFQDMMHGHKEALDEAKLVFDGLLNRELKRINEQWVSRKKEPDRGPTGDCAAAAEEEFGFVYSKQKARQLLKERLRELSSLQMEVLDETKENRQLIKQFKNILSSKPPMADLHSPSDLCD